MGLRVEGTRGSLRGLAEHIDTLKKVRQSQRPFEFLISIPYLHPEFRPRDLHLTITCAHPCWSGTTDIAFVFSLPRERP